MNCSNMAALSVSGWMTAAKLYPLLPCLVSMRTELVLAQCSTEECPVEADVSPPPPPAPIGLIRTTPVPLFFGLFVEDEEDKTDIPCRRSGRRSLKSLS